MTEAGGAARIARALASPTGVLVTIPLLVIAIGVGILLVGRDATRGATRSMARHQLTEEALGLQGDVAFALDGADPLMSLERGLADRQRPLADVLLRLRDLLEGRPGVAFLSISFPDGTFRGAQLMPDGHVEMQQSQPAPGEVQRFVADGNALRALDRHPSSYDPRTRGFYQLAIAQRARAWTEPYTFFESHATGITCTEPVIDASGAVTAVLTVDFDVSALSRVIARPGLDEARSYVYTKDGTILAHPATDKPAARETLLRAQDLGNPALDALFASHAQRADALRFLDLSAADGEYLVSIAPLGGKRAGVPVQLDWYVATLVPAHTLLGATRRLERSSIVASAGALAIAVALALVLAWNLVRMRAQVQASREEARTAEARARDLGSYRLVAKLGAGGMGEVWRAEHRLLARSAAIKLIRPDANQIEEIRERFRREAQTLASMKSRNTIAIYDYGVTSDDIFYYVMELLDGLDLESLVVRYGPQPAARVIAIISQACHSLAEAHEHGLFHRDIKPPNLFLCRAADEVDIVKLLDFGIVQSVHERTTQPNARPAAIPDTQRLTQVGMMLGTPGFMAPEQILGMKLDARADLYSLGCVAWWLLAGSEVFARQGTEARFLQRHLEEPPPSLRDVVKGWLPPELAQVIAAMLAKDAAHRPASAREIATRLAAIAIPAEHAWTPARAAAWWQSYTPPAPVTVLPSEQVKIIVAAGEKRAPITIEEPTIADSVAGPTAQFRR